MSAAARIIEKNYDASTNMAMAVLLVVVAFGTATLAAQSAALDTEATAVEPSPASMY